MELVQAEIADRIRKYRVEKNYTQEYVAELLGLTQVTSYSKIERGVVHLSLDKALRLSQLYQVSLDELLIGPKEKNNNLEEERETYKKNKHSQVQLSILLNGDPVNLHHQIELLKKVNEAL